MDQQITLFTRPTIDQLIAAWLHAKRGRTDSPRTERIYQDALLKFRQALESVHFDLDGPAQQIAFIAQGWAGLPWQRGEKVSNGTFNLRLAALSSFYRYAMRHDPEGFKSNPITLVERRNTQEYASAHALSQEEVQAALEKIDRSTPEGLRDYALLCVALTTGRRVAELASLRWEHAKVLSNGCILLHFERCKGNKQMDDLLSVPVSRALRDWLQSFYGGLARLGPASPLWVSLSHHQKGHALTTRSLERICLARLGTSKAHTTRHTFARSMEDSGAKVSEITMRLAQSNPAVVGRYLARLRQEANPHAEQLADMFGIK